MPDPAGATGLTDAERQAADAVEADWLIEALHTLVSIPSVGGAEDDAQAAVATLMRTLDLDVDQWSIDVADLATHPDYSAEIERKTAVGLVGRSGGAGRQLMFNGHIDVVPVGDASRWSFDPWAATPSGDMIYGRGTCDMKGGLASALAAVAAVHTAGIELDGSVSVASVVGEEDGGLGTLATLLRGHTADGAVIVEPTNLRMLPVQAGSLGFRLTVRGAPAHGALRTEGVSAITKAQPILTALAELEARRNQTVADQLFAEFEVPFALSVGTLRAGEWPSTVPDTLVAEGRYGMAPGESAAGAQAEFEEAIAAAAASDPWLTDHPPEVTWWGGRFLPAVTSVDADIVAALGSAHRDIVGATADIAGAPYGSDLRHLVNTGRIPSVLYGPGDPRIAHRADECVPVSDLIVAARTLAVLIVRWCGDR